MDWGTIINNTLAGLLTPTTIAFALAALGLAMHFGFAGLLNFGIAGFMAIGAYGYAISVLTFGFPWWGRNDCRHHRIYLVRDSAGNSYP